MNTGRAFLPMVCTTVGAVGPRPFLSFVRRAFDAAIAREILDGGRGCLARYRSTLFFASLHPRRARPRHLSHAARPSFQACRRRPAC